MELPDKPSMHPRLLCYAELAVLADDALMGKLREGHYDALAVLFDRYHRLVMNVALRILRDAGEAEDLMQSVFLEVFRAAAQFDPAKGTTKVWILQYAYHRSFNRRQYLNLRGLYESPDESIQTQQSFAATHSSSLSVFESARLVQQALARLNKMQKRALELAIYEGLTMREISEKTGESFVSVRHHYYRGLDKLRLILCAAADSNTKRSSGEGVAHVQP